MVRRTGVRVGAKLRRFNPMSLGTIANGLIMLSSLGIADKRTMIELAAFAPDPERVLRRVEEEKLGEVP
jgi:hypothetical protein